jgi:hypothetical protein
MTCKEFRDILPDMIDGEAQGRHADHLHACDSCSELVTDLKAIATGAKVLCAVDDPNPRVWANIRRSLEEEGLIKVPMQSGGTLIIPPRPRRSLWAWATPIAALVALIIGIFIYTGHRSNPTTVAEDQVLTPAGSEVQITSSSISRDDDEQILAELSPAVRATYADNLRTVNSSILEAQQALQEDPGNDEARHFLMDAYQQRDMLYQLAMDRSVQ